MAKPPWTPLTIYHEDHNVIWVASETIENKWYQVFWDGTKWKCTCPDYLKKREECKHILAYLKFLGTTQGAYEPQEDIERPSDGGMIVPSPNGTTNFSSIGKWVKKIHGKDFIEYAGLLAMAHERGLQDFGSAFIVVTETLALAEAWAIFKDGRRFWDAGDATPNNVHIQVKAHFPRVALTRAKARVLRDALNIGMVSVEELEE